MGLPMGDDALDAGPGYVTRETVEQDEQFGKICGVSGQSLPGRFGEGPTRPRLVDILESCFEIAATGQVEVDPACNRIDRGCCLMELGEHRDNSRTLPGGGVLELPARLTFHEREEGDGVARPNSTHRFAVGRADWCDHEAEACIAEGNGTAECAYQAGEDGLPSVSEPGLPLEVVDGDEAARSARVGCDPVVAPKPDRRVVDGRDVEAPSVSQAIDQRAGLNLLRQGLHSRKARAPRSQTVISLRSNRTMPSRRGNWARRAAGPGNWLLRLTV